MKYGNPKHIETFLNVIKNYQWRCEPGDPSNKEMLAMYASDRKDFRKVLSLYRQGKWKEAAEFAGHMDTAARDYIPNGIWEEINDV
jgi:hypothetical protein